MLVVDYVTCLVLLVDYVMCMVLFVEVLLIGPWGVVAQGSRGVAVVVAGWVLGWGGGFAGGVAGGVAGGCWVIAGLLLCHPISVQVLVQGTENNYIASCNKRCLAACKGSITVEGDANRGWQMDGKAHTSMLLHPGTTTPFVCQLCSSHTDTRNSSTRNSSNG